jgi:hypothetical protein
MQEQETDFSLADAVKIHILQTLTYCNGNRTLAAKRLGISIRCLRNKLRAIQNTELRYLYLRLSQVIEDCAGRMTVADARQDSLRASKHH